MVRVYAVPSLSMNMNSRTSGVHSPHVLQVTLISVPQLCAYIFAILFEFSGIFDRLFWLNLLYFRRKRRPINRIWTYSLCHQSAMRPPHACYVIQARDGRSDRKHCFWSTCTPVLPSQFRNALDQSESRTSPSAVLKQAECITFTTMDHFIISPTPPVKNITIYGLNHLPLVRSSF